MASKGQGLKMVEKIKNTKTAKDKVKRELLIKQKGKCPISGRNMTLSSSVLDHCHLTGYIRAALPRGVNGLEGKVAYLCTRFGGCQTVDDNIKLLKNLISFWELHKKPQTDYIYPAFKTDDEKREARNRKARLRYAKSKKERK